MDENKLTDKQEEFCQQYLIDLNGTQAAIRAGYSADTAYSIASENMIKPKIQARLAELMEARRKRCQVSQDEVVLELKRIAFSDMRKIAKWDGDSVTLEASTSLSDDDGACVESVARTTTKDGGSISCKLHSKTKALELLARHLGMLHDKVDHTTKGKSLRQPPSIIVADQQTATMLQDVIDREKLNAASDDERISAKP
jgi:phage terminase small subunit